jgi:hypothetical protein
MKSQKSADLIYTATAAWKKQTLIYKSVCGVRNIFILSERLDSNVKG